MEIRALGGSPRVVLYFFRLGANTSAAFDYWRYG